jgi:3-methyladenine DNA glycosylase AlkD
MNKDFLERLRTELKNAVDERTKDGVKRFFKEEIKYYGIKNPVVTKIAKQFYPEIKKLSKSEIFALCEELFQSGYIEESFIACNWAYKQEKLFEKKDFYIFEKWVKTYVHNWATCDTLCNHTVGSLIMKYPDLIEDLKKWAISENRWVKRASAVSLIIPARKGLFLEDIFGIANILLLDSDDMVQKGYGWMLKSASEANQKEVFEYVMKNKKVMPRTALRYAIEKMPDKLKKEAMKKYFSAMF